MVVRFGKYVLLKRIATGGMAELYLARQTGAAGFEKLVVVKRILEHLSTDQDFVGMFLNEARLASSLTHPNIVQVHDLGQEAGAYFMAMDFVAGHDLYSIARKAVLQSQPIPPRIAARIMAGASAGLHYAHTKKNLQGQPLHIVHRDVSPANILVSYEGDVKVTDFGIAKADAQSVKTKAGVVKGKFSYMSPEQIKSLPLDGRSDVFALGITLHEVLTGRRLFRRDSELAVMHDILETAPPAPSSLRPGLSPALDAICERALEKDAGRRYPSAQAMQQDLEAFLSQSGPPDGAAEIAAYMLRNFAEEHAAYQKLLQQLDTADPGALAQFIEEHGELARNSRMDGTGSATGEKHRVTSVPDRATPGPATLAAGGLGAVQDRATPGPATLPPRSRWRGPLIAAGVLAVAAAAGAVLSLRLPVKMAAVPPPPPSRVEGAVQVDSEPAGARILLDGSPTGLVTPATITPLSLAREHKLRLEREGFQPKEIAFTLTEQMAQKAFSAGLMPVAPPPAEEGTAAAAKEPEPEPAAARAGPRGHAMGTLQLSSEPVADVLFQRKAMGKTPAKLRLPVGKVELVLVNRELSLTRKVEVDVPRSGVGTQAIAFQKGKLAADVKPWADVYVGARKLGTTPFAPRELYEGTYVVKLVNSDLGAIKEVQVTVTPGNTTVLRAELP